MDVPDALPLLSRGAHHPADRRRCAMEVVSYLAGRPCDGDAPQCVASYLTAAIVYANDSAPDDAQRARLWPVLVRVIGTADLSARRGLGVPVAERRVAVAATAAAARDVFRRHDASPAAEAVLTAADAWAATPGRAGRRAVAAAVRRVPTSDPHHDFVTALGNQVASGSVGGALATLIAPLGTAERVAALDAAIDAHTRLAARPGAAEPEVPWEELRRRLGVVPAG